MQRTCQREDNNITVCCEEAQSFLKWGFGMGKAVVVLLMVMFIMHILWLPGEISENGMDGVLRQDKTRRHALLNPHWACAQ